MTLTGHSASCHSRESGNPADLPSAPRSTPRPERDSRFRGNDIVRRALISAARFWQRYPSAILPPSCRFTPSCSAYAIEAVERYGAARGGWLAVKRLCRCHPLGGHGYDPVP